MSSLIFKAICKRGIFRAVRRQVRDLKPLILVVEDHEDVLYNLQITLEFNEYEVLTAKNGEEALKLLLELETTPDLIISDIMMPKMNGYDLFHQVSSNPLWGSVPFIFLSALATPKDVRFGKMLGVDDYLVKPFNEEDLLAIIKGKIARHQKYANVNAKIDELFTAFKEETTPSLIANVESIILLLMKWDEKIGPTLEDFFPKDLHLSLSVRDIGFQLYNGVVSIYGKSKIHEAQGILLNIENIGSQGYIFFDSIEDRTLRGGQRPIMLGIVTPKINYFESLKVKEIFQEITPKIKEGQDWDIESYWKRVSNILTSPVI